MSEPRALTKAWLKALNRSRRAYGVVDGIGPPHLLLGSEVLFKALELSDIEPGDLLRRLHRRYAHPELGQRSPLFGKVLDQLPGCTFVRIRSGIFQVRCDGGISYSEEGDRAVLVLPGRHLPESVRISVAGHPLSALVDVRSHPALHAVDPTISSAENRCHAPSGLDPRIEFVLKVGWRPLGGISE